MKKDSILEDIDIKKLLTDTKKFNEFVYSPLSEAMKELQVRWEDKELETKLHKFLQGDFPRPLVNGFKAVLFRQLFTPNYEFRHFMSLVTTLNIKPMFLEYHDDKFTSQNPLKHSLGKIIFHQYKGKNGNTRIDSRNVIEFNINDGKRICEIQTIWGQSLIDFHHELLESIFPGSNTYLFDGSLWFHRGGKCAKEYYTRYMALFVRNGILFENFILDGDELRFVREVFLPAFIEVWKKTGKKPQIVSLLSLDTQANKYWISHPIGTLTYVEEKKKKLIHVQ